MNAIAPRPEAASEHPELDQGHELNRTLGLYLSLRDLFDQELPKLRDSLQLPEVKLFTSTPFFSELKNLIFTSSITPQCTLDNLQTILKAVVSLIGQYTRMIEGNWSMPPDLNLPYWSRVQSELAAFKQMAKSQDFPITGETQIGCVMDFLGATARQSMQRLMDGQFGMPRHVEVGTSDTSTLQSEIRERLGIPPYEP